MCFGNEYDGLHLEQLTDTTNNELIIVISLTKRVETFLDSLGYVEPENNLKLLSDTTQLTSDGSQIYKIYFENYIMYQGRNESYAFENKNEFSIGQGLVLFKKSKLLDFICECADIDLAMAMHKKTQLRHYGVYTLNNMIDIVTFYEPTIEKLSLS